MYPTPWPGENLSSWSSGALVNTVHERFTWGNAKISETGSIRISTSSWPTPDGVIVLALSVRSRRASRGYAKNIVLALIQSFGFVSRLLLLSNTVHSAAAFGCARSARWNCFLKVPVLSVLCWIVMLWRYKEMLPFQEILAENSL